MTRFDWLQNLMVIAAFALVIWVLRQGWRSERWARAVSRLRRDRLGLVAGVVIALYLVIGALEMLVVPTSRGESATVLTLLTESIPQEESFSAPWHDYTVSRQRPVKLHAKHLLGTDALGKDVLVHTLRACKTALVLGGLTTAIYVPIATLMGLLAGYFRRWVDDLIQYAYTVIYSVPEILLLIALIIALGQKSLVNMAIALSITSWVNLCRLIRGETLRQNERPYVAAARSLGQTHWQVLIRHLLPNVMHLVVIQLVLGFSNLVLAEAMLSYLGVGSPIGTPSWGNMIDSARGELSRDPVVWWTLTSATAALFGLVLSLNIFGDALRKAFDPRRT
jgi:peptide/nickel transport system permease protein